MKSAVNLLNGIRSCSAVHCSKSLLLNNNNYSSSRVIMMTDSPLPSPAYRQPTLLIHSRNYSVRERRTRRWACHIVDQLSENEREILYEELMKMKQPSTTSSSAAPLTPNILRLIAFAHGLPFIGFGFLDNAIMIIAGEYIDFTLGTLLGFSTMAAAGLGNLVSDLVGIGSVGYVELWAAKVGVSVPQLTAEQLHQKSARFASFIGRSFGITIGCLLGMLPLLFFEKEPETELDVKETQTEMSSPSENK